MILAFLVSMVLFALLLFRKKKPLRRRWYTLFSIGLIFALLLSFVSVLSVWNPWNPLPNGNYSGASAVSYPLWMNIYATPAVQRILQNDEEVGNVSFSVFIANGKVLEINGVFRSVPSYAAVPWGLPVNYELGSPFFSDTIAFFSFLVLLFTLFNVLGFTLGMILCYIVSRMMESKSIDHLR
jgi:hypothetical protein